MRFFQRLILRLFGMADLQNSLMLAGPQSDIKIVVDLDELTRTSVAFRWKNRTYVIPPLELEFWLKAMNELAKLDALRAQSQLPEHQLLDAYHMLFFRMGITPELKRSEVQTMHHKQIGALVNLIAECVMGKAQVDYEKKSLQVVQESRKEAY